MLNVLSAISYGHKDFDLLISSMQLLYQNAFMNLHLKSTVIQRPTYDNYITYVSSVPPSHI